MRARISMAMGMTVLGLLAAACNRNKDDETSSDNPTSADIADVSMLVSESDDSTGAGQLGQPAELLTLARMELKRAGDVPNAVLRYLAEARTKAQASAPVRSGRAKFGPKYAVWEFSKDGVDVRLSAVRINERRIRYMLSLRRDAASYVPVLTGIFVKSAERQGGRFHLDLSRATQAMGIADGYSGSVHFSFASRGDEALFRRVIYRNVRFGLEPAEVPARNYGVDLVRKFGVGGRARFVGIGDYVSASAGQEIAAMRVLWKTGAGGRADAVIAPLAGGAASHISECWDKEGLRTGYADDITGNEATNKNEGEVTQCVQFARDVPPDATASASADDADPDVSAALAEAGADISEADANAVNEQN